MLWSVTTIDAMNLTWRRRLLFVFAQAAAMLAAMEAGAAEIAVDLQAPVPKYVGVYTQPPNTVGSLDPSIRAYRIPDGPLMGNGDIAVAVGGTATEQTFYLSKSDLSHSARGVGGLTISFKDATADDFACRGFKVSARAGFCTKPRCGRSYRSLRQPLRCVHGQPMAKMSW